MAYFDWSQVVKLTDYNTIKGNKFKEISINRFLNKLEKSIDKGNDFKRYDYNTFSFWYPELHETYYLCLDETLMANFDKGFYTSFTKELKRLLDKKEKMDKEKSLLDLANEQSSRGEEIDKEALPLYLSEKRKDLGFSFSDINDYFKNLKDDLINVKKETARTLNYDIWPYNELDGPELFIGSLVFNIVLAIPAVAIASISKIFWLVLLILVPEVFLCTTPVFTFIYNYGKTRINRLINFVDRRKYVKEEIKSLTKGNPEIKLITDEKEEKYIMLDEKTEQNDDSFEISKLILKEIGEVTNDLNGLLNESDKMRIGLKIQELLDEFNERFFNIDESNKNGQITLDGMQSLKFNMIPRIENIKREIALIKSRELIMDERMRMSLEIENNLQQIIKSKTLKKDEGNN